jgi:HSP20 family molecular chaperone IbpA
MSNAIVTQPNTATTNDTTCCVYSPNVDVYENDTELLLIADVPGAAPDRVSVDLLDSILSISAELPKSDERKTSYRRQFKLAVPVDADKITAELRTGELLIRLGKAASHLPKRIDVKAS